jgi:ribitol-5-phosphate 2-dehydrogenase (NADP+) / D-ribitol-5-phosphate cytidylyltransferase
MHKKTTALLLMAGTGERFGSALPKQFHRLAGKKIYLHTLERFLSSQLFDEILLVAAAEHVEEIKTEVPPSVRIVSGGKSRQESSYLGLLACKECAIVCIHDAVRPFVTTDILRENIVRAQEYGAVNTYIPSFDTLVYAPGHRQIHSIPLRSDYLRGQTPQTFHYSLILEAHEAARAKGISDRSDDCALVLERGAPVHLASGSEYNIKITTELDLCLAEQILRLAPQAPLPSAASLKNKRYVVTGGTGGIGSVLCQELQREGAHCIPLSRTTSPFAADLTSYTAALAAFKQIEATYGPVDGLINSIGSLKLNPLNALLPEEIEQQLSTNLKALIFCCKCASLKEGAHIVNIASSSYVRGRKEFTVYASAKAAVVNFTQGLAEERPDLRINAIVPQRTLTRLRSDNFRDEDPDSLLEPHEVAREIVSLLKQNTLTGAMITVRKLFSDNSNDSMVIG